MKNLKVLTCLIVPLFVLVVRPTRTRADEIAGDIYETRIIYEDSELVDNVACFVHGNPCIKFGASDIKLRLNGFTITGQTNPPTNCAPSPAGEDGIDVVGQQNVAILGTRSGAEIRQRRHIAAKLHESKGEASDRV